MADDGAAAFDVQAVGGGFPRDYRRLTQLYCMNGGYHLQMLPDGTVQGLRDDGDAHSKTAHALRIFTSRAGLRCGAFTSCRKLQVCRIEKIRVHFLSGTEGVSGSKMGVKVSDSRTNSVERDYSELCAERTTQPLLSPSVYEVS